MHLGKFQAMSTLPGSEACDEQQVRTVKNAQDRLLFAEIESMFLPGETIGPYEMLLLEELMDRYWIAKGKFP